MLNNLANHGETHNRGQYRGNEGFAWLAGIIDGEGYVGACRTNDSPVKADLAINNCSMNLLTRCQEIVQSITGRKYSIHRCSDRKGRNFVFYSFRISDQHGIWQVLRAIRPWLTAKATQADAMIEFCESRKLNRHKREGYTAHEAGIVARLKELKHAHYTPHPRAVETECETPNA